MNLGRTLSTHTGLFSSGGWFWYIGGILLAAGLFNLVKGAANASMSDVVTALVTLALAPLALALPVLRWRQTLTIYEEGFVSQRLLFGEKVVPRASIGSVTRIQHYSRMGAFVELVVKLKDGTELSMSGLDGAEQAANLIAQLAAPPAPQAGAGGWAPPGSV